MLCRILSEDETTALLREQIVTLTTVQLLYLEEVIKREKRKRQHESFVAWQEYLQEAKEQGQLPNKIAQKIAQPSKRFDE